MITVQHECDSCNGTGLYSGMCEGKGRAVICLGCDGQGWVTSKFKPFTGRKKLKGIKEITRSRGSFIATGCGPVGDWMSYERFEQLVPSKTPNVS